jgi:hypothetical protein
VAVNAQSTIKANASGMRSTGTTEQGAGEGEWTRARLSRRTVRSLLRMRALLFLGEMKHDG